MAKILIIDSHKGADSNNLHLQNAHLIADHLGADLIWSYKGVNDKIKSGYDVIIFNHASHYSFVDYAWLEASPHARLFHITNEYNLGEPRALWMAIKRANRRYTVIANHPPEPSKIVKKYVDDWHSVNLNALVFKNRQTNGFAGKHIPVLYYGSFRKDRVKYFNRYLRDGIVVSTYYKNVDKFDPTCNFVKRIDWDNDGLSDYFCSLYLEDETTHTHYNFLANRFYEALNYNVVTLFAEECHNTIDLSGYRVPQQLIVSEKTLAATVNKITAYKFKNYLGLMSEWKDKAAAEKAHALLSIRNIIFPQKADSAHVRTDVKNEELETMTKTAKKELATLDTESNPFVDYGRAAGGSSTIIGQLLKFSKGEYVAGQDEKEIPIGTRLAVNMGSVLIGWQRWQDNRPVEQAMGPVMERFQVLSRDELGWTDQAEWEIGNDGKKRDPWQLSNMALMKATDKSGDLFTFTTNSKGGIGAIGRLCKAYGVAMREHADQYPVIELGVDTYKHAEFGKIPFPTFTIVDWVDASEFDEDDAAAPARKKIRAR